MAGTRTNRINGRASMKFTPSLFLLFLILAPFLAFAEPKIDSFKIEEDILSRLDSLTPTEKRQMEWKKIGPALKTFQDEGKYQDLLFFLDSLTLEKDEHYYHWFYFEANVMLGNWEKAAQRMKATVRNRGWQSVFHRYNDNKKTIMTFRSRHQELQQMVQGGNFSIIHKFFLELMDYYSGNQNQSMKSIHALWAQNKNNPFFRGFPEFYQKWRPKSSGLASLFYSTSGNCGKF